MINLSQYGWNDTLQQLKEQSTYKDFLHGRVSITHKTCYEIVSELGFFTCELTGNMLYGREASEFPGTGDWVLFQPIDEDKGIIYDLLHRERTLYRLKSGTVSEKQTIAANIDKGFIVQSLDSYFNVRRIERFVLQLDAEDIQPVLVLTKTDLGFDKNEVENSIKHLADKLQVFYTSIEEPESIDPLRNSILEGETVVFAGMSGVGKSTLVNALCQEKIFETNSLSDATGKGKHTSTRREMVLMKNGGVLIDTPGVKLFGVTNDETDSLMEVLDLSELSEKCKYKDCQHINEQGCAIIEAVKNGEVDQGAYENFLKLRKEAWHYTASVQEKRKTGKSFAKMVKEVKKYSNKR